jgi:hypothetical protein
MLVEPEQFLHAHGEGRALGDTVIDGDARSGRHLHMGGRLRLEPALQVPRQQSFQRRREIVGA